MSEQREYAIEIEGWDRRHTYTVTAKSPAQARYIVWLDLADCINETFGEFLVKWVRSGRRAYSGLHYDYVQEFYGVDVKVGDRVKVRGGEGRVAHPPGSNGRWAHVWVTVGDEPAAPYHPKEVRPL